MTTIMKVFYRPTENHVGVIYSKWGKFKRFANPNEWTLLSSGIEEVTKEVRLDMRTAILTLENVFTSDMVAVDIEMKAYYSIDLRKTSEEKRMQALHFEGDAPWGEIVKTSVTDIVRNVVVISQTYQRLATDEGLAYLKQIISRNAASRLRSFGILMDNRFAVSIMNLQPNKTFQEALQEVSAAKAVGNAAVDRLRPLFEQFGDKSQNEAFDALVMQIAAVLGKSDKLPDIAIQGNNDAPFGNRFPGNGNDLLGLNIQRNSLSRQRRTSKDN
ncbi:MAG: hypothetical protein IPP66_09140 [Anaerolineales bacterium]|nr:hypothetical protein [Anaerolineales bacterium]